MDVVLRKEWQGIGKTNNMKLILFLLLITATVKGQTTDHSLLFLTTEPGMGEPANYTELKTLREENKRLTALNDSLQSKINKLLEYHYYSCEIISGLKPNGQLANRRQYHKAIRAYFDRYGMAKARVKAAKF